MDNENNEDDVLMTYNTSAFLHKNLTVPEMEAMLSMCADSGWKLLMRTYRAKKQQATDLVMNPMTPDEIVDKSKIDYAVCEANLYLKESLDEAVKEGLSPEDPDDEED